MAFNVSLLRRLLRRRIIKYAFRVAYYFFCEIHNHLSYHILSWTVIFAQHVERGRQDKTVTLLTGFRNYLHYHLKATKTYMHMRMRKRVVGLLQGELGVVSVVC